MNYLLDTHAFIWWNEGSPQLPAHVRQTLSNRSHHIWLSHASVWEMQIKVQIGKLRLRAPLADVIDQETRMNRLRLLPISYDDIMRIAHLPMHHRDPFDRMILAQTLTGGFHLVANDSEFAPYGVPIFW